jgi:hypothetical protein
MLNVIYEFGIIVPIHGDFEKHGANGSCEHHVKRKLICDELGFFHAISTCTHA